MKGGFAVKSELSSNLQPKMNVPLAVTHAMEMRNALTLQVLLESLLIHKKMYPSQRAILAVASRAGMMQVRTRQNSREEAAKEVGFLGNFLLNCVKN